MNKRINRGIKVMNKKGIFYSLSVMLFLIFLIIVFNNKAQVLKKDEQFHIERAKIIVMDHFVRDFDRYYAQNIIETAARPALINLTRHSPFAKSKLIELMTTGQDTVSGASIHPLLTTSENFNQSLATLSFKLDKNEFSYTLADVDQPNYYTIKLNFHVDYLFSAFDTNWSKTNKDVNITVQVYGLWHPDYYRHGTIDNSWVEYTTGCYAKIIFRDGEDVSPCPGKNIKPIICGDGVLDPGEDCDGTATPIPPGHTCTNCQLEEIITP